MTILVDANLGCNFCHTEHGPCTYCYNTPLRETGKEQKPDLPAMEKTVRKLYAERKSSIVLHGGEPLFMDRDLFEKLLKLSYDLSEQSALQTNGSLIDDKIIALFKQYKTSVGVSIDGYYPANEFRCDKKTTQRIIKNIKRLHDEKINVGLIIVLSKANAVPERIEYVKKLLQDMWDIHVSAKINVCTHPDPKIQLTVKEAIWAYLQLLDFCVENQIQAAPFTYIRNLLLGDGSADCIFGKPCDPYSTMSGTVVCSDGRISTCTKFTEERLEWTPHSDWRWDILKETDCKNCKYGGVVCSGGCPAGSLNQDYRNKTQWCTMYKTLYEEIEKILRFAHPNRALTIDKKKEGKGGAPSSGHNDGQAHSDGVEHVDGSLRHLDSNWSGEREHGDSEGEREHADRPHGDYQKHGDSG